MILAYSSEHLRLLDVKTTFRLQKSCYEDFWCKHFKNQSCKCYLGNKEQISMFLVVSRSYVLFGFERQVNLRAGRKLVFGQLIFGRLERNLSNPISPFLFIEN